MTPPPRSDRLERHALLMLLAALCGHIGNALFHTLTGRHLPLEDYGLMVAVLSALQVLHLPLTAFSMSLARTVAATPAATRTLLSNGIRALLALSLLAAALLWTFQTSLLRALSTTRLILLPLTAALIALSLFLTLTGGILQGRQAFRWLAARALSLFLLRAAFCAAFLFGIAPSAETALFAHLLAMLATLALSFAAIRLPPESPPTPSPALRTVCTRSLLALPALTGFAILLSADVLLVRRFFPPELSGRFAQAAVLARMVLWLPLPIASAMYPKVTTPGPQACHTLRKAAAYTLALLLLTLLGLQLTAPLLLQFLYGDTTPELLDWTRRMALAVAPLAFTQILLHYTLAQNRYAPGIGFLLIALAYLTAVTLHHPTIPALIHTLTLATTLSALLSLTLGLLPQRRPA